MDHVANLVRMDRHADGAVTRESLDRPYFVRSSLWTLPLNERQRITVNLGEPPAANTRGINQGRQENL